MQVTIAKPRIAVPVKFVSSKDCWKSRLADKTSAKAAVGNSALIPAPIAAT
jgi:hypothetical protein